MNDVLQQTVTKMLRPLVRLLLRHGIAWGTLTDWLKRLYIETAAAEFTLEGRKQSVSRIAVLTGINRKEVKRVMDNPVATRNHQTRHNRAARVIHGWLNDPDFTTASGEPAPLRLGTGNADFAALVKRYSGDIPSRALLDELLRAGIVAQQQDGNLQLLEHAYIPCQSDTDMLYLAGDSVRDLLETIDYNLDNAGSSSRLQLSVVYDNLPHEAVERFRGLSRERATALLQEMDQFLSRQDRDSNPQSTGSGRYRAGLGIYYFEEAEDDASKT
jgi:hypothetical protein